MRESVATETFGPYEVYERLGMGGMASVHRAKKRGPAGFERTVALKRMLQHLAEDRGFVDSFVREAKVASLLVHPNIAQVYDFGRIGGVFYIAMEMVAGFDLRKLLRHAHKAGEAIPLGVILTILAELCDALDYAHSFVDESGQPLNIVHRDISPSNIIVAHTGHVKVIDFGIAKASSRQLHTETGMVKGKLGYMAPEAAMGLSVSAQSDMFSIGVTAWELVTALPLFSSRTDFETMRKLREEPAPPPSYKNPACPPRLDALILSALAREPEQRIASARAFRAEIDVIAHECNVLLSARAVAEWIKRLAEADATGRAPTVADESSRLRSPSGRQLPLPAPEPTAMRPRSSTRPPTALRRSSDDIALATEIWGEDNGTQGQSEPGPDFSMNSVPPLAAGGAHIVTAPEVHALPALAQAHFTPSRGGHASQMTNPQSPHALQSSPQLHPSGSQVHPSGPQMHPSGPQSQVFGYAPSQVTPPPSKSKLPLLILALLAVLAGIVAAILYIKKSPAPAPVASRDVGLTFTVEPSGATVDVAGKDIGSGSPVKTSVTPGVYSINIHKDGYKPWTTSLAVREGEDQTINIVLEKEDVVAVVPDKGSAAQPDTQSDAPDSKSEIEDPRETQPPHPGKGTAKHVGKNAHSKAEEAKAEAAKIEAAKAEAAKQEAAKQEAAKQEAAKAEAAKQEAAKQEAAKQAAAKAEAAKQIAETKPKTVPTVGAGVVTKTSGDIPQLEGSGDGAVFAKTCIDETGRVTSVSIKQSPPNTADDLQRALSGWHYKPYMKNGAPSPVCFPVSFRVVFKQ